MFGVVPRPLWSPVCPPDERNRIPMACNCLLIRTPGANILVETGCGDRFSDKDRDIFAVGEGIRVADQVRSAGVGPDEVTDVVLTHLHFDHAAGALSASEDGLKATFANAVHWVQAREWQDARSGLSIMRSSYIPSDLERLFDSVQVRFLDGDSEISPAVRTYITGGHTAAHQSVVVAGSERTLAYLGDLIPTRAHLSPYWIMAYDMHPHDTFTQKQAWTQRAFDEGWIVAWDHDPESYWSVLRSDGRRFLADDVNH